MCEQVEDTLLEKTEMYEMWVLLSESYSLNCGIKKNTNTGSNTYQWRLKVLL